LIVVGRFSQAEARYRWSTQSESSEGHMGSMDRRLRHAAHKRMGDCHASEGAA